MRTSLILTAAVAGGALATPVKKWLEERALVINYVTTTTVVWVTAGEPQSTVAPVAVAPVAAPKKAAVAAYHPHHHAHAHAPAPVEKPATTPASDPQPPASPKPVAPAPAPEKAAQPPVEPPKSTSTLPAPAPSPETNSGSTASTAPTTYPGNLDTTSGTYKALALQHHNVHRANHSADDLVWDDQLASYAEQTAKTCVWGHDLSPGGGGYGQNIAAGTPAGEIAKVLTGGFYNDEMMLYPGYGNDNPDMGNFEKWGHFSQMLWQSSKKVGCYTYTCSPPGAPPLDCNPATGQSYLKNTGCGNGGMNAIFTVCNYSPPGNYAGQYSKVGKPNGKAMVIAGKDGVTGL